MLMLSIRGRNSYIVQNWENTFTRNTWTVQCSAMQCSAGQCSAVQCSAVQCSAAAHLLHLLLRVGEERLARHDARVVEEQRDLMSSMQYTVQYALRYSLQYAVY
jgi:hypothetical protein